MNLFQCPGSDSLKRPYPEEIECPFCGGAVEIWSDEEKTGCPGCGSAVRREMTASCWQWCGVARECLGPEKYDRLKKQLLNR